MNAIPAFVPTPALTSRLRLNANDHIWWTTIGKDKKRQKDTNKQKTQKAQDEARAFR